MMAVAEIRRQHGELEVDYRDSGVPKSHQFNRGNLGEATNGWYLPIHEPAAARNGASSISTVRTPSS